MRLTSFTARLADDADESRRDAERQRDARLRPLHHGLGDFNGDGRTDITWYTPNY